MSGGWRGWSGAGRGARELGAARLLELEDSRPRSSGAVRLEILAGRTQLANKRTEKQTCCRGGRRCCRCTPKTRQGGARQAEGLEGGGRGGAEQGEGEDRNGTPKAIWKLKKAPPGGE